MSTEVGVKRMMPPVALPIVGTAANLEKSMGMRPIYVVKVMNAIIEAKQLNLGIDGMGKPVQLVRLLMAELRIQKEKQHNAAFVLRRHRVCGVDCLGQAVGLVAEGKWPHRLAEELARRVGRRSHG